MVSTRRLISTLIHRIGHRYCIGIGAAWAAKADRKRRCKRLKYAGARADILGETVRSLENERGGGDPQYVQLRAARGICRSTASGWAM